MRTVLFFIVTCVSNYGLSHDYYFAFAEIEYNEMNSRFECTVTASAHDIEPLQEKLGLFIDSLSDPHSLSATKAFEFLKNHFQISAETQNINMNLIGIEVMLNGTLNFYLESEEVKLNTGTFDLQFDLLMDVYAEQQNKATVYYRNETYTGHFLHETRTQTFQIHNEEIK